MLSPSAPDQSYSKQARIDEPVGLVHGTLMKNMISFLSPKISDVDIGCSTGTDELVEDSWGGECGVGSG